MYLMHNVAHWMAREQEEMNTANKQAAFFNNPRKTSFLLSLVQLPPPLVTLGASLSPPSHFRRGPLSRRAWHCG